MPVLCVFVNFEGCAVERGVLRVRAVGDGTGFHSVEPIGWVWCGGGMMWQVERCDEIKISHTCYSCCDVGEPGNEMRAL
jgi:hypothetical protein